MGWFSCSTAAGAGFGIGGIVSHRAIPVNVECTLPRKQGDRLEECHKTPGVQLDNILKMCLWYLGHMGWQLGTNKARVVMVHTGVHARDDHRPRRRLTRDAWIMADVAVLSCFLHITGPNKAS